ncbi:MAG: aromatic ring-hydroxylating dioxygenase subunit alpha [Actinobacteria bacterium]|nr:aromatic ring-hydroxylating dioxygenase subunit alpha [Actinomycetota bacterium]
MTTATGHAVCTDPAILNQWYAVAAIPEISVAQVHRTRLLDSSVAYSVTADGECLAWRTAPNDATVTVDASSQLDWLPTRTAFGYLWMSVGEPPPDVFEVQESAEPDRRTLNAATIGIAVSAPRAIENFLDMAHFPYVHPHMLGEEPHTEVADYTTELRNGELWAVDCRFYQPKAAVSSTEGVMAEYLYRVPSPYCAMLYKSSPGDAERMDVIGIFVHPISEEFVRANLFLCLLDDVSSDTTIRRFQQTIFSQDKPILENQYPKRLPLDPRAETPIRADKMAIAYRRWLTDLGVTYGVIPA